MFFGNLFHRFHYQLILVGCYIYSRIDGRKLVLRGSHFVMFGFCGDSQFPQFLVEVLHKICDSVPYRCVILVGLFLSLCGRSAEQRASRIFQVFALHIVVFIDKKIFLLASDDGGNFFRILVSEKPEKSQYFAVKNVHTAQQRSFFIQRFARVRAERRRYAKNSGASLRPFYECGRTAIPYGIASRFERCADSSRGKTRRVRFAF